jgi:hypothetical protein
MRSRRHRPIGSPTLMRKSRPTAFSEGRVYSETMQKPPCGKLDWPDVIPARELAFSLIANNSTGVREDESQG